MKSKQIGAKMGGSVSVGALEAVHVKRLSLYWLHSCMTSLVSSPGQARSGATSNLQRSSFEDQHDKVCGLIANKLFSKAWQLSTTKGTPLFPKNLISQFTLSTPKQGHCHGTQKLHYQCVQSSSIFLFRLE